MQTPWVDVRSIGAGGGSIALRRRRRPAARRPAQRGRATRARPATAAAAPSRPSPTPPSCSACSARARSRAASRSTRERARGRARAARRPRSASTEPRTSPAGSCTIAAANMADAIREITVEQGRDPREAALVAVRRRRPALRHAAGATSSTSDAIVVPPHAGNFSAWGLLGADLAADGRAHAASCRLGDGRPCGRGRRARSPSCSRELDAPRPGARRAAREVHLDMRYVGQEHTLTIAAPVARTARIADDAEAVAARVQARVRAHVRPRRWTRRSRSSRARDAAHAAAARARAGRADRRAADGSRVRERRRVVVHAGRAAATFARSSASRCGLGDDAGRARRS